MEKIAEVKDKIYAGISGHPYIALGVAVVVVILIVLFLLRGTDLGKKINFLGGEDNESNVSAEEKELDQLIDNINAKQDGGV